MAFTFQINNDVKFKHDEKLLAKAEGFRPEIKKERIHPTRIVEVIEDPLKLNGVGVTESDLEITESEHLRFISTRPDPRWMHLFICVLSLQNFRQSLRQSPKTMKDGSAVRGYRKSSFISMSFRQHWNFREDTASVM